MSDAIKKLHDYLAMSPSVVYPEDVLAYLPAIEDENAKLRNEVDNLLDFEHLTSVAVAYAGCDECGEYKQTMLRLFAENAKLRDELDLMTEAVEALHSAPLEDQLVQALNVADKLRELVQRMWRLERFGCYGCRRECDAESCYASECKEAIEIEQEMRDLGIEVDE